MLVLQRIAEKAFVVAALLLYTGAIAHFIPEGNPLYPVKQTLPNIGLAITLLLLAIRWKWVLPIFSKGYVLWLLVLLAPLSVLWSDSPMFTVEQFMPLLRVSVFGLYFASRFRLSEQMQLLAWTFGIASLLSLLFGFVLKSYGVVGMGYVANLEDLVHAGAWRGPYIHKTALGSMMVLGALVSLFCALKQDKSDRHRILMWGSFALSVFVLLRSTTKGALIILMLLIMLLPLYRALRLKYSVLVPALITMLLAGGGIAMVVAANAESALAYFGKDLTLTGRTELWPLLIDKIWSRPWLGYSYLTFWEGGWGGHPGDIWQGLKRGFEPPHAHNGFLEVMVSFGIVGLLIMALNFLVIFVRSLQWIRLIKTEEGLIPLVYLTFTVLLNLSESFFMRADIYWLLYISVNLSMYSVGREINEVKNQLFYAIEEPILKSEFSAD